MFNNGIVNHENYNHVEKNLKNVLNLANTSGNSKAVEEEIYYNTAKNVGRSLNVTDYNSLAEKIMALGIGQIVMTNMSDNKIVFRLYDCFTCSEMENIGKPVCYFEAGILAGAVSTISNQDMDAIEVRCNALGDDYCEFEITPAKGNKKRFQPVRDDEKPDINMLYLTINSLKLAKSKNQIQSQSQRSSRANKQLNVALENALEADNFNQNIIDSIPNYLAVIDNSGMVVRINKKYQEFLSLAFEKDTSIISLAWESKYTEVLSTGKPAIWRQIISGKEHIIFESPILESQAVLRQVIPVESDFIKLLLDKISDLEERIDNSNLASQQLKLKDDRIVVFSEAMIGQVNYIRKVARTDASILIRGESGTGKTMFAEVVHQESPRSHKPFIYIDCTTIPKNFFETELFGYTPGAFTGASKNGKAGKLEMAQGGTVFLDEIAEIPIEIQSKLLRFLQEKKFEKMGDVKTQQVDTRVIAATSQNLEAMIRDGLFRKDLYYRLNVINIVLPPLRERRDEIPALAAKILSQISEETKTGLKRIDESGIQALMRYDWPGNIRELENLLKRLSFLVDDEVIKSQAIITELHAAVTLNNGVGGAASEIRENERELIIRVLENCQHNKSAAAEKLGITRQTLYNKIKKYQIS
ncbi:sigma 54-interacting transcriptional regulator [Acetobacterium wieringae]|uniref:sigma 54-interacting transcriptional regulator n=1 Tax=Acetobacterium wieringae TaxID=52694 RepID=UPI0026F09335|nr:sigma 54-interacting transcriptional regulator [Acetobacterium wieringae]